MWSAIDFENQAMMWNRWSELASRKCDAYAERTDIANTLSARNPLNNPPDFNSEAAYVSAISTRIVRRLGPAYRAVRLSEVAGIPVALASDIVKLAAEHFAMSNPELAIRLLIRACNSDTDDSLNRVLSRARIALIPEDSVRRLVGDCIRIIDYSLARGRVEGIRVTIEVLSKLVLRLDSDSTLDTFDYALEFYCNRQHQVTSHVRIASPLRDLLNSAWEALSKEQRTLRALDLLGAPIVGMDGFTTQIAELYPDPGELVSRDPTVLRLDRSDDNEKDWAEIVALLLRALSAGGESRNRAATRLVSIVRQGLLNKSEISDVADALWAVEHTTADGLPDNTSLYDWVFLTLPEPKSGLARERFRSKWISGKPVKSWLDMITSGGVISLSLNAPPNDPTQLEDALWNIGKAITGLRAHGRHLELADAERKYVVDLISQWACVPVTVHAHELIQVEIRNYTLRALSGLMSILSEVDIPTAIGETLFEKLKSITETGTPAYGSVGSLVQIMPHRATELITWLRTGLASSSRETATGAIRGLACWLQSSNDPRARTRKPNEDLIREVGLIIAVRREGSLSAALRLAKWIFEEGSREWRDVILNYVLEGLDYLSEELRYERAHDDSITDLRWQCVQLALSMSKAGLESEPSVIRWLELASNDPFPKVRHAMVDSRSGL